VSFDSTEHVKHIAYNAKGQRLMIAYGNGKMTRYNYDVRNFRLQRYHTESYDWDAGSPYLFDPDGGVLQDCFHRYDLSGNIINIINHAPGCGISGSTEGENKLTRTFKYDALYRLLEASGREINSHDDTVLWDDPANSHPLDINDLRAYNQEFEYDLLGITQRKHF